MVIEIAPDGQQNLSKLQGIPLAQTFAHTMGFKETVLPTVGTRVLCYGGYSGFCLIIGSIPATELQTNTPQDGFPSRAIIGAGEPLLDKVHSSGYFESITKSVMLNNQLPTDVVQGEKVIANEFGVMIGLFQLLSVLKGSELAQVQCHFLDDLVRIISHNFQHYHSLGETNIFHDGKGLHMEVGLTHDPKEALGVPQIADQPSVNGTIQEIGVTAKDDSKDFYKLEDERMKAVERLKLYVGKLGDFINLILLAPNVEKRSLNGEEIQNPDRGLFQLHVGLDGMFTVRTVNGIVLEKTNWIRVPQRIRTPEDPEGDDATKIDYPVKEVFKFDETYVQRGIPFLYYLQLKDYLAHLDSKKYANFEAHEKDFFVNQDYKQERPLESITFVDPITGTAFKRTTSFISLMPNGGVTMSDAWGSSIVMEGGNIYIQPANDLVIQSMRDVVAKVGRHLSVSAKKELDVSSTEGGFRLKTDKSQYLYSDKAGIVLHAEGPFIEDGFVPEDSAVEYVGGIVLKAPKSGVQTHSRQLFLNCTENAILESKRLIMEAEESTHLLSDKNMFISSERTFVGADSILEIFTKGSAIFIGDKGTVVGKKDQTFAVAKVGTGIAPVEGLIDAKDKNKFFYDALIRATEDMLEFEATDYVVGFKTAEDFDALQFRFLSSDRYALTDSDIIPQTLVQLEDVSFPGLHNLEKWIEVPVNDTYPYPGADRANTFITASINNVEKTEDGLVNKVTDLQGGVTLDGPSDLFNSYTVRL
jgi:hypothetical protein